MSAFAVVTIFNVGAVCFGVVVGWVTHRTLRRKQAGAAISDIAAVVGAVGGGAVLGIFKSGYSFGWYAIGLAGGFFLYFIIALLGHDNERVDDLMGD